MNEWERRVLEITKNHMDLRGVVAAMGSSAVVESFGYVAQIGSVANPLVNGVPQQAIIPTRADSWFVIEYISAAVILPGASTFGDLTQFTDAGNISLQITDTGAAHQELYNLAGPAGILTGTPNGGTAGVPLLLPTPRPVPPNTNIKIEATQMGVLAGENPQPVAFFLMLNGTRVGII
jgi:hypothetical protein